MSTKKAKALKKSPKKVVKKQPVKVVKKTAVKKLPAKKTTQKLVKKTLVKKPVAKPSKLKAAKIKTKKVELKKTKAPKKLAKKLAKKLVKKIVKKPAPKAVAKKAQKPVKALPIKKVRKSSKAPKKPEIQPRTAQQTKDLSKSILSTKNIEKKVEAAVAEHKSEALHKTIVARKSEGRVKPNFKIGDHAIYPSHGLGKIADIEKMSVMGQDFSCYLMYFEKEKLTIKIPMNSAEKIGLRHLVSKVQMDEVFVTLRSGVKKLKGMWSRRAQEYETKINSGDIMLLAEVLRDLTRDIEDGERSYSERIIYETAIYRLATEYCAIYDVPFEEAKDKVTLTAKDKLNSEGRIIQKDEFDEFEMDGEDSESADEEESEDEEEEEEEEDDDYDDEDEDDKPRKKRK